MDPSPTGHEDDAADGYESRDASDAESEASTNDGDQNQGNEPLGPERVDPREEELEEDDDSDAETQRIGSSVLRFSRRCVKTGEFAKAMTALQSVVDMSELDAVPCRQALFFAAQVLLVTNQETRALACLMDIWDNTPPPYMTQDAQLFLAVIHERLDEPRRATYWFTKAFRRSSPSLTTACTAWLSLADRSFDEGDFVLTTEASARAFACVLELPKWPSDVNIVRFVGQFLTALTSVAHLRPDRQSYRQHIAFSLALAVLESNIVASTPLVIRAFDPDYLRLRRVYATLFPTVYDYLFRDEDDFVGRISRAWRVCQARRARRRAIEEREERLARDAAEAATKKRRTKKKPVLQKKSTRRMEPKDDDNEQLRLLRQRTKARIASFRSQSPPRKSSVSPPKPTPLPEPKAVETIASPTRRKLETVKRLRHVTTDAFIETTPPSENQTSPSPSASLLDVYAFPPLASRRHAFETDAGRSAGAADLLDDDLQAIEAFARLAHYRSRVLVQNRISLHDATDRLDVARVTPPWLRQFHDALALIEGLSPHAHFSDIHARVVMQLMDIHTKYRLKHGKTTFTIHLRKTLRRLETWQLARDDLVPALKRVQAMGEQEEAVRNLEFYHATLVRQII